MADFYHWSPGAVSCYELNGDCSKCEIPGFRLETLEDGFEVKGKKLKGCQMQESVQKLFKKYGPPPELPFDRKPYDIDYSLDRKEKNMARSMELSNRELEVAALVSNGLTNRQIAEKLTISLHTAKAHVVNIIDKLHLDKSGWPRVLLGIWFIREGHLLIKDPTGSYSGYELNQVS